MPQRHPLILFHRLYRTILFYRILTLSIHYQRDLIVCQLLTFLNLYVFLRCFNFNYVLLIYLLICLLIIVFTYFILLMNLLRNLFVRILFLFRFSRFWYVYLKHDEGLLFYLWGIFLRVWIFLWIWWNLWILVLWH